MGTNNHKKALKHIIDMKIYSHETSREFINFVAINYPSVLNAFMGNIAPKENEFNTIMFENLTESYVKNKISERDIDSIACRDNFIDAIKTLRAIIDSKGERISLKDARSTLDAYALRFPDRAGWKKS